MGISRWIVVRIKQELLCLRSDGSELLIRLQSRIWVEFFPNVPRAAVKILWDICFPVDYNENRVYIKNSEHTYSYGILMD